MNSHLRKIAIAGLVACALTLLAQSPAVAQMPYSNWPNGGRGYFDPWGNYYWFSPVRMYPGTDFAQPGTYYSGQFYMPGRGWGYREHWIDPYGVPRNNWVYPGPFGRGTFRYHTNARK
jgi:hypothetical protein